MMDEPVAINREVARRMVKAIRDIEKINRSPDNQPLGFWHMPGPVSAHVLVTGAILTSGLTPPQPSGYPTPDTDVGLFYPGVLILMNNNDPATITWHQDTDQICYVYSLNGNTLTVGSEYHGIVASERNGRPIVTVQDVSSSGGSGASGACSIQHAGSGTFVGDARDPVVLIDSVCLGGLTYNIRGQQAVVCINGKARIEYYNLSWTMEGCCDCAPDDYSHISGGSGGSIEFFISGGNWGGGGGSGGIGTGFCMNPVTGKPCATGDGGCINSITGLPCTVQ